MADEHFSPDHKRVKFDAVDDGASEGEEHVHSLRVHANSRIHLCFHDHLLMAPFHAFPTYTHQLFDKQQIQLQHKEEKQLKVEVHIDTRTLRHAVNITGVDANGETYASLVTALKKGVPSDTTFHSEHHFHFLSMQRESDDEQDLLSPPGSIFHSFAVRENEEDHQEYVCYHCSSDSLSGSKLLKRAEKVAMWFIETADGVEFLNNPQWEVSTHCDLSTKCGVVYLTLSLFLSFSLSILCVCLCRFSGSTNEAHRSFLRSTPSRAVVFRRIRQSTPKLRSKQRKRCTLWLAT
jgi:translation initiation factor 1 (eIF-1/SUI1)